MKYSDVIRLIISAMLGGVLTFVFLQTREIAPKQQVVNDLSSKINTNESVSIKPTDLPFGVVGSQNEGHPRYTLLKALNKKLDEKAAVLNLSGEATNPFPLARVAKGIFIETDEDGTIMRILPVSINDGKPLSSGTTKIYINNIIPFNPEGRKWEVVIDWGF